MLKIEEKRVYGDFEHVIVDTRCDSIEIPVPLSIKDLKFCGHEFWKPRDLPSSSEFPRRERIDFKEYPSIAVTENVDDLPVAIDIAYDLMKMYLAIFPKYAKLEWWRHFTGKKEVLVVKLTTVGGYLNKRWFFEKKQSGERVLEFDFGVKWMFDLCDKFNSFYGDEPRFFVCIGCLRIMSIKDLANKNDKQKCKSCVCGS